MMFFFLLSPPPPPPCSFFSFHIFFRPRPTVSKRITKGKEKSRAYILDVRYAALAKHIGGWNVSPKALGGPPAQPIRPRGKSSSRPRHRRRRRRRQRVSYVIDAPARLSDRSFPPRRITITLLCGNIENDQKGIIITSSIQQLSRHGRRSWRRWEEGRKGKKRRERERKKRRSSPWWCCSRGVHFVLSLLRYNIWRHPLLPLPPDGQRWFCYSSAPMYT